MYAVIRHHRVQGAAVEELARQGKEDFAPMIKTMPGFVAYTIIAGQDMVSTVSIFQDKAAADESTRKAVAWAADSITEFEVPTEVIEGEVNVLETA